MVKTTRKQRRELAHKRAADKDRIAAVGRRSSAAHCRTLLVRAIRAYERGQSIAPTITEYLIDYVYPDLAGAMVAGHLSGVLASAAGAGVIADDPLPLSSMYGSYGAAVEFLQTRAQLNRPELDVLRASYGREAATVTREVGTRLERFATEAIEESTRRGEHVRQGVARMRAAFEAAGVTPKNPYLFTTLYRTQTALAYGAGQAAVRVDPVIDEILWGYEYFTVGDDRVRPSHVGYDGVVLPKGDPQWQAIMPPNGYNCRCEVIEVFEPVKPKAPPEVVKVDGQYVQVRVDDGWDFSPADLLGDVRSFGPGLLTV